MEVLGDVERERDSRREIRDSRAMGLLDYFIDGGI